MDERVKAITDRLAAGLEAMLESGCDQVRLNWDWRRGDNGKVLDSGEITIRRGKNGYLARITTRWGQRRGRLGTPG